MGVKEFDEYFSALYGERWTALRAALGRPGAAVEYGQGLAAPYRLDAASVSAAQALRLPDAGLVLDACAAPGGKTLVLASRLPEGTGILANELSSERRRRLSDVLDAHLPAALRSRVTVSGFDAAAAGARQSERGRFAAILLDAPCSSERHVLASGKALKEWSPARVKFLAQRQWSLLSSCFLLLADGGSLVYATCALSPAENDGPMARLFKKYGESVALDILEDESALGAGEAERSAYGVFYAPDRNQGAGPLYIARVRKVSS
jgi:16S rRNA C967 or C1407 C5-methylase (RsmB/RsmF family)